MAPKVFVKTYKNTPHTAKLIKPTRCVRGLNVLCRNVGVSTMVSGISTLVFRDLGPDWRGPNGAKGPNVAEEISEFRVLPSSSVIGRLNATKIVSTRMQLY